MKTKLCKLVAFKTPRNKSMAASDLSDACLLGGRRCRDVGGKLETSSRERLGLFYDLLVPVIEKSTVQPAGANFSARFKYYILVRNSMRSLKTVTVSFACSHPSMAP